MQRKKTTKEIVSIIKKGGVGVMPTDTIFGIVGSALAQNTVERIYRLRKRNPKKPCIILIASMSELKEFGAYLTQQDTLILKKIWPDKVTVVLPVSKEKQKELRYLHRGTNALAFRLPKKKSLQTLLQETGPLIAPSANFEGERPAQNLKEARGYFMDEVDFYVAGKTTKQASTILKIDKGEVVLLREGTVNFPRLKARISLK